MTFHFLSKQLEGGNYKLIYCTAFFFFMLCKFLASGFLKGWEPGLYPDAGLHYTTGVLVQKYLTEGLAINPLVFVADFQEKYAFVGLGLWPPIFHGVEGVWMAIFSNSRTSVLLLDATIVASAAIGVFHYARTYFNNVGAFLVGLTLCFTHQFLTASEILMIDVFTAIITFLAALKFSHYLTDPTWKNAWLTSMLAITAILSKGTGISLVFCFPLAVIFTSNLALLRTYQFWAIPVIIAVVCGPYYLLTAPFSSQGFRFEFGLDYTLLAVPTYGRYIFYNVGLLTSMFALVGIWSLLVEPLQRELRDFWASMAALFLGVYLFQVILPVALQDRYIAVVYFPIILLAFKGVEYMLERRRQWKNYVFGLLAVNAVTLSLISNVPFEGNGAKAIDKLAQEMPEEGAPVLLVASPEIEGLLAAEILMNFSAARLEDTYIVRGVKLFGGGGYNNLDYIARYKTQHQVWDALREIGITYLMIEHSDRTDIWKHNEQVANVMKLYPSHFQTAARVRISDTREISVVKVLFPSGHQPDLNLIRLTTQNKVLQSFKEMVLDR